MEERREYSSDWRTRLRKSTQAEQLSRAFGLCHISSGDLFRREGAEKTKSGLKVKASQEKSLFLRLCG